MLRHRNIALVGLTVALLLPWPASAQQQSSEPQPATQPKPAPKLKLSLEEWDFGTKWFGEPCSAEITISNVGNDTLEIIRVHKSCGCTVAKLPKYKLAPGESIPMKVSYNTRKNKPKVSQYLTLETNDPERPRVKIHIKGEVKHVYEAKPGYRVSFGRLERDSKVTQTIDLRNNMSQKVFLKLKPDSDLGNFTAKLESIEEGQHYKLTVSSKPPLDMRANVGKVLLETGIEQYPVLEIPISAYVAPRVSVMPKRLFVSPRVTKEFQRIIRVSYRPNKPLKIVSIKTSHPDLIRAEQIETPTPTAVNSLTRFHQIRVTLPPGDKMPKEGGWIEIETDDPAPEYHKLRVEVQMRKTAGRIIRPMPGKPARPPRSIKPGQQKSGKSSPPATKQEPADKRGQPD